MSSTQSAAQPPTEPAHGVDAETFVTLWSGDRDTGSSLTNATTNASAIPLAELAGVTDIAFAEPPEAAEQWNRGDHTEFPTTDHTTSIRPTETPVTDGVFIRDAYAAVFAVQPSTRLWQSPTEQPQYVGDAGEVLGTVDYRIQPPAANQTGNRYVEWSLLDHRIEEVRLRVDDTVVDRTDGTHTPTLRFSDLAGSPGTTHTLTLEATIAVELSKRVVVYDGCEPVQTATPTATPTDPGTTTETWGGSETDSATSTEAPASTATPANNSTATLSTPTAEPTECQTISTTTVTTPTEQLTVQESVTVVEYAPSVSGAAAQYPDGTQAVALSGDQSWRGYTADGVATRGTWRFYTARETRWDTLVSQSRGNVSTGTSPLQPLQVHAYPSRSGAKAEDPVRVTAVDGAQYEPPVLPEAIDLDVVSTPYTASETVVTTGQQSRSDSIVVHGLVRGTRVTLSEDSLTETTIHPSELTLTPLETTEETVTVEVELIDARTGAPIQTAQRDGTIHLQDRSVDTDASGTAVATIPRPVGALSARYEPAPWWTTEQAFTESADTLYIRGTDIPVVATLYQLAIPIGSFLVAVFLIGRATGWDIWPLWGRR